MVLMKVEKEGMMGRRRRPRRRMRNQSCLERNRRIYSAVCLKMKILRKSNKNNTKKNKKGIAR